MAASTDTTYYVGQGNVTLAPRISSGAINGGAFNVGDCSQLQVSFKQGFVDLQENQSGKGYDALHAPVSVDGSLKMTMQQWSSVNLTKALWGTAPTGAAGGTVTAETTTGYNGGKTYLANVNITSLVLTKLPSTVLVEGTDYTVDGSYGSYTILPGSTLVPSGPGVALAAAYTFAPNNGNIQVLAGGPTEYAVTVESKNVANPFVDASNSAFAAIRFQIYRVQFALPAMLDLIGRKDSSLDLEGKILIDPTVTGAGLSPFMNIIKV